MPNTQEIVLSALKFYPSIFLKEGSKTLNPIEAHVPIDIAGKLKFFFKL